MSHSPGSLGQPEVKVCPVFPQTSGLYARPLLCGQQQCVPPWECPTQQDSIHPCPVELVAWSSGSELHTQRSPSSHCLEKPLEFVSIACTSQAANDPVHQTADGQERAFPKSRSISPIVSPLFTHLETYLPHLTAQAILQHPSPMTWPPRSTVFTTESHIFSVRSGPSSSVYCSHLLDQTARLSPMKSIPLLCHFPLPQNAAHL